MGAFTNKTPVLILNVVIPPVVGMIISPDWLPAKELGKSRRKHDQHFFHSIDGSGGLLFDL